MDRGLERKILATLVAQGQLSVSVIADRLNRHPVTVDRVCYDLQTDGYIVITSSGASYKVTSKGRSRLDELQEG